jgi:hypothetical protein
MAALNNVPRKHNKRSTPRSSSSGTARPVREQGGDRRHPAGGNPRLRACSRKPPDGLLHGTVELREALGPELIIHFSAPQVQPAEMASIVDLPRDMSTVGMHGGSGGDARWSLRRALRHGVASLLRPRDGSRATRPGPANWRRMLTNAESGTRHQPTEHRRSSPTDPLRSEPAGTGVDQDDVVQLREALRAANARIAGTS